MSADRNLVGVVQFIVFWPGSAGIVVPRIVIAVGATVGAIDTAIFEAVHLALSAWTQGLDGQGPVLALLRVPRKDTYGEKARTCKDSILLVHRNIWSAQKMETSET